jgi:hypothetical protein
LVAGEVVAVVEVAGGVEVTGVGVPPRPVPIRFIGG